MKATHEPSTHEPHEKRDMIRQSLKEITSDISSALFDARLVYPMYVCVPSCGALLTIACPLDPDDGEWDRITEIAREIVEKTIGATRLETRNIACAWAGTTMAGTEVVG